MTVSREEVLRANLASLKWHVTENTVNKEVILDLIEDCQRLARSQGGKAEPDAWLVGWHSANGDAGTSVYTTEDEARRAAKNMEAYRSSETMTDVLPLYAAPLPSPPENAPPMQPTEAMLNAARDWSVEKYGRGIGNDAAIGCWQAMLSAALVSEPLGNPSDPGWVKGRARAAAEKASLPREEKQS